MSSFIDGLRACDWNLPRTAMRHPVEAMEYAVGKRDSFGPFVAWDYARKVVGIPCPKTPPLTDLASLESIRALLANKSEEWSKWDASDMQYIKAPLLYHIVRLLRPDQVVETGVASGVSSLFILKGLSDNAAGSLTSIDLPNADPGAPVPPWGKSGWIVPDSLRSRWELRIGDSKRLLPSILDRTGKIQVFLHDSLHTYDHMMWEFETAWPHITNGGLLLSDDAVWNDAFKDFCHRVGSPRYLAVGLGLALKRR